MSVLDKGYHKTMDKHNKYYRHKCLCKDHYKYNKNHGHKCPYLIMVVIRKRISIANIMSINVCDIYGY